MPLPKRDQHIGISGPNQAAVAVTETDAGRRNADVVENAAQLFGRDFLANGRLNLINQFGGFLNAGPAAGPKVKPELAGIHVWKKILSKLRHQQPRANAKRQKPDRKGSPAFQKHSEHLPVALAEAGEAPLKPVLDG